MFYNIQINLLAAVMVLLILRSNRYNQVFLPENKSFRQLLIHLLILLALDAATWAVDLQNFLGARPLNLAVNYAIYIEQAIIAYQWGVYSHRLTHTSFSPARQRFHRIPLVLGLILLATNPFTQRVFTVSMDNEYARGWGVWGTLYALCVFYYLLEAMVLAVRKLLCSSSRGQSDGWYLLVSSSMPALGTLLQMLFYGTATIWSFCAVGTLILYLNVQTRHMFHAERELEEGRVAVMMSQIQPHFLYNSLTVIKELCEVEPQKAVTALDHFSFFLRGNLDCLADSRLVPFPKELIHVQDYLALEQLRFQERLHVQWDIMFKDFLLPPLTLQPIVENAVRHGVTKTERGGTVTIGSEKREDTVVVTIRDNGMGFEPGANREGGRTHSGIDNVRKRLEAQCGGALEIESRKCLGTEVRIILPIKGVTSCE